MQRGADDRGTPVFVGVDTHSDVHLCVALDRASAWTCWLVSNDQSGYAHLLEWALGFGTSVVAGIEDTGSYGAGLSRFVRSRDMRVVELNRTSCHTASTAATVSMTPLMPRPLLVRSWPEPLWASPRAPTEQRKWYAPSGPPDDRQSRPRPRRPTSSARADVHRPVAAQGEPPRVRNQGARREGLALPLRRGSKRPGRSYQVCPTLRGPPLPCAFRRDS
ncbi:MAG: hypothetical protein JOZ19_01465 [Rubrobacter sp.]|nr:hypothetical protein [Rubrobacter sp.]